jgi:hypothetical protein
LLRSFAVKRPQKAGQKTSNPKVKMRALWASPRQSGARMVCATG